MFPYTGLATTSRPSGPQEAPTMSITRYRPVRFQPVPYSAVRPDPFLGLLDGLLSAPV